MTPVATPAYQPRIECVETSTPLTFTMSVASVNSLLARTAEVRMLAYVAQFLGGRGIRLKAPAAVGSSLVERPQEDEALIEPGAGFTHAAARAFAEQVQRALAPVGPDLDIDLGD